MLCTPHIIISHPANEAAKQCECACPGDEGECHWTAEAPLNCLWERAAWLYSSDLGSDYSVAFNPFGEGHVAALNGAARQLLAHFETPRPLDAVSADQPEARSALNQLITLGFLVPQGRGQPQLTVRPSALSVWLHVTNACNLRCDYCYLTKTEEAMTADTARQAIEAICRSAIRHGFKSLNLKYAGGEATLNLPLVRLLHAYARDASQAHALGLSETVLSNGVALSGPTLEFLRDEGIGLMISLDGVGEAHDAQRRFVNGRGSFQWVARSIDRAVALGLKPSLSITVSARNADRLADAVAFALDRDLRFNLNFFRENDCASAFADLAVSNQRLINGMRAAFRVIEDRLPAQRLMDGLVDLSSFRRPHEQTCGAGHSYMVVDQRGGVAQCQMEIERPITSVWADDPLGELRHASTGFRNLRVTEKEGCRDCPWRFWCAGGCPLLTYRATGRNDIKSPYCDVYKALYPDVIRLEGLRMLKWQTVGLAA
jgi:uncharacterized protein